MSSRSGAQALHRRGGAVVSGGSYEETRPRARLGFVQPAKGRAIETFPASATMSERNRSEGQWRRAFAPTRCVDDRAPSGDRSEARRSWGTRPELLYGRSDPCWESIERAQAKRIASNCRTDGRASSEERSEERRRQAPPETVALTVAPLRRSGSKRSGEGHRAERVHGRSEPAR
jgi:hypothetical protein